MNDFVCVGKLVNTHGIKGEVRILSDFDYKERVFKKGVSFYLGKEKQELMVSSYRHHKMFEMVTFEGINNINDVLKYKGDYVFVKRATLDLENEEYVLSDTIGCLVYDKDKLIGTVKDYYLDNGNTILEIEGKKIFYIPIKSPCIKNINTENRVIKTDGGEEFIL